MGLSDTSAHRPRRLQRAEVLRQRQLDSTYGPACRHGGARRLSKRVERFQSSSTFGSTTLTLNGKLCGRPLARTPAAATGLRSPPYGDVRCSRDSNQGLG